MLNRRDVLNLAVSAGAAAAFTPGVTRVAADKEADTFRVVDTNVSLFHWPFRRLPLDETLRLYPPVNGVARRCLREFEFMGHTIPANSMVVVPNLLNMRLEEFFTDPDTFDPERFAPGREEHKKHSFAWVPFGGGAHKCIGLHFAEMLVKITLFELLRTSNIESTRALASPVGGFNYIPFPKPRDDLPVKIAARP